MKMKTELILPMMAVRAFLLMVITIFVHKYNIPVKPEKCRLISNDM
jgi:hypothetical protein